ncbi:MAG TPA: DNA methyltransferase, partial [Anaerolineae bacterium]|nr:DNA methyltransferase [Anaerolineae bacterium]
MNFYQQTFLKGSSLDVRDLKLQSEPRTLDSFRNAFYSPGPNDTLKAFIGQQFTLHPYEELSPLKEPLVAGKNTYVYDAHTYHTKVPPEAIVTLIQHYTQEGDLILDPFAGSGMTGVAALRTRRKPILIDLSPASTFIAFNFLTPLKPKPYIAAINDILAATASEELALYGTHCRECGKLVPMEYMVWSYGLICAHCQREVILWDVARDERENIRESKIRTEFDCPFCGKHNNKRTLRRTKAYPVQVGYRCCASGLQESKAPPDDYDLNIIAAAEAEITASGLWYPTNPLPPGINTKQPIAQGLASIDKLYTARNLRSVAQLWDIARRWPEQEIALKLMFNVTSLYQRVTKLSEFRFWGGSGNIANYNVPMISNEQNVFKVFHRKAKTIASYFTSWSALPSTPYCISTQSATDLSEVPDQSIDYVFTDPPFGANINYSEMNFLWEAWLGVFTNPAKEAIINRVQHKSLVSYKHLMREAFSEVHRVLKPDHWLTIVFHNSSGQVWEALRESLLTSGFSINSVQTLDKRHGTFKQFVSENAVGYDLILHCQRIDQATTYATNIHSKIATQESIFAFLSRTINADPGEFVVHYLHVKREDELNARKLYSLWLTEQLQSPAPISTD